MTLLPEYRRQLVAAAEQRARPRRRARLGWLVPAHSAAVAVAVAAVFLFGGHRRVSPPQTAAPPPSFVLRAEPTAAVPKVESVRIAEALRIRLSNLGVAGARVRRLGASQFAVTLPAGAPTARLAFQLSRPPRLRIFDWEGSVLLPDGRPVAHGLRRSDPVANSISQGVASLEPGDAGSVPHADARRAARRLRHVVLLGCVTNGDSYYVARLRTVLTGADITDPHVSTDTTGQPDVAFGFTTRGGREFQRLTRAVARRGELLSTGTMQRNQHFAFALGNRLISVPQIDFHVYPDGISGGGADIAGGFTRQTAQQLVDQLLVPTLVVVQP